VKTLKILKEKHLLSFFLVKYFSVNDCNIWYPRSPIIGQCP
jgi:hypothetical protein